MINKRGLTPDEFKHIDDETLEYLMVYDMYVEPSGTHIDILKHAYLCQTITLNNPNMTKDIAKSIKTSDYDFLGVLGEGTTKERIERRKKAEIEQNEISTQSYMKSRMEQLKGKHNGK